MKHFTYLAKTHSGKITKGSIEAKDQKAAAEAIEAQSLTPISVKEETSLNIFEKLNEISTIPSSEKVMFSKQLATLIGAGIPISQSINILGTQTENKRLKRALIEIGADIEGGLSLSSAMEKHPTIFNSLFVNMIRSGEMGGTMDQALERMAEEIEKEHELVAKIRGAMAYPSVILIAMFGVVIYMITNIIPQIGKIFTDMGGKLPGSTLFLMSLSKIFASWGIFIVIALVAIIYGYRRALKTNVKFRYFIHLAILKTPIFGKIVKKVNISRITRTFGSLLSSGVAVLEALKVTADAVQNEVYKKELRVVAEKVKNGSTIAEPLKKSKFFPMIVSQMISVGEETGTLDKILKKLTDFYEREVDNTVKSLSSIVEPLMMIIIGVMVGFIVISVISPIYQMSNLF